MSPEQIAEAEAFLADPDGEDCERFTSRYGRSLIEIAKAHWKTRAEGPAPVSARRSPADQDQQLVDQMRAAHARVWTEQGWRSEQSLRDGYEVWTLDSTGQRRIILARGCTPNVAALMCIVSTGLTRLCDLADAPVSAPLDREGVEVLRQALSRIARWFGEFPDTGRTWDDGSPMSYAAVWGSNGERDYMRGVASEALALTGQQDQVGLTTPAVLGEEDIDGLPSRSCADGSLPVLKEPLCDLEDIGPPTPLGALRFRMEQGGHTQNNLAKLIGNRARASEILSGKRALSKAQIATLADAWGIPARSLLGPTPPAPHSDEAGS